MIVCLSVILFILIRKFPATSEFVEEKVPESPVLKEKISPIVVAVVEPEFEVAPKYSNTIAELLNDAKLFMTDNKLQQAEDKLIEALQEDHHCADAYTLLGDIYYHRKRVDEATESYKAAIHNDDDQAVAHFGLAGIYESAGRLNDAAGEVLLATKIDSGNDLWYKKLADLYMDLRMYAKAEMAYRKAENLRPDYSHYKQLAVAAGKKQLAHKVGRK
jgi:tetratricopeptide (TPR) repeat protein